MSRVFVSVSMSLDGFLAPEGMTLENWDRPDYKDWGAKWGALMSWVFPLRSFRERLKLGEGGETGPVDDLVRATFERTGASILGKRMFEGGERGWPEEAPFWTPVFVLTHEERAPWERPGGTTFYFITDGAEAALERAREAAGGRDVRIAGGANAIQQYLNLGAVDELEIALVPVLFGGGVRLFDHLLEPLPKFRLERVLEGSGATHIRYTRA